MVTAFCIISEDRIQKLILTSYDLLSITFLVIFPIFYIESSYKWISPKILFFIIIVLVIIVPQREQFLFD